MTAAPSLGDRRELGAALQRWAADSVGVVRVLGRHGFGTVESGQLLAGISDGRTVGQVYLGALDSVAVPLAIKAMAAPAVEHAHVAEASAVAAGGWSARQVAELDESIARSTASPTRMSWYCWTTPPRSTPC